MLDEIVQENTEDFIQKVETEPNDIDKSPDVRDGYKRLKELYSEAKEQGKELELPFSL